MGRFREAEASLRQAMRRTERLSGDDQVSARARVMITWSWTTVALRGRLQALELLGQVRALTDSPRLLALSYVQEAVVHVSVSDWREALTALGQVGAAFDLLTPREQTAALLNGGLSHLSLLELTAARVELERALSLSLEHDLPEQEFKARHNLGCLEFYAGHLPEAIRLMRSADEVDAQVARARARQDLAQVLLEAGLLDQARETLGDALRGARAERLSLEEADIRLDLASCALIDADATRARGELDAAIRIYRSRGAKGRQRSTSLLRAAVDVGSGKVPRGVDALLAPWLESPRPVTPDERLASRVQVEARLLRGDLPAAAYAVARLRGRPRQGLAGDMHDRLLFAKVAAAQGDPTRARREVRAALHRLTARQAPTQSLEVRAALALHGRRLSEFDLADALAGGSARRVFDSVERWRAISHRLPPVASTIDPAAADLMAELRQARRALGASPEAEQAGRLRARVAELEWQIAQRDWSASELGAGRTPGSSGAGPVAGSGGAGSRTAGAKRTGGVDSAVTLAQARDSLAARAEEALVFFTHEGDQHLLHVATGDTAVRTLGAAQTTTALTDRLLRDLRAHSFASTNPVMERALARAVDSSLAELDHVLFAGLDLAAGAAVVVVPGRALASVPWGALPTLTGRPVTVATSMTHWASSPAAPTRPLSVAALAGPGLRRAEAETEQVAAIWGPWTDSEGERGTDSKALRRALDRDTVVHVAAHGTHERQNPYFSSLQLADGPVFAHELPRPVVSTHVVLSACDVGQSDLRPGDEPLGLTAALLSLGVRSVVAAVAPVPDAVAEVAMVDYHRQLADGIPASVALAQTLVRHPGARAFCLYGSDWTPQIQRAGSLNIAS